jgi:glutamate-1-semialdehyde 2,1-aminomutase
MAQISPDGPVYQAGTLSGNPVAMAAGLASLNKLKQNPAIYVELGSKAKRLMQGFQAAADAEEIPLTTEVRGSMFGFFFNANAVKNFADAQSSDTDTFAKFHAGMLRKGIYLACSAYETGFISTKTTDEMIEETIIAAYEVMREIRD